MVGWRDILEVLLINTVRPEAEAWKMSGGEPFHWAYYLTGVGGRMMLPVLVTGAGEHSANVRDGVFC